MCRLSGQKCRSRTQNKPDKLDRLDRLDKLDGVDKLNKGDGVDKLCKLDKGDVLECKVEIQGIKEWSNSVVERGVGFMMLRNYMILGLINEGSAGKVYLAVGEKHVLYALKFINKSVDFHSYTKIRDELEISYGVRHENVVETVVIMETRRSLVLVMEYCAGGDLITFIRRNGAITEDKARNAFKMILNAVKYLHNNNIYHRDIKPENLLIHTNNVLKLCDFGASIRVRGDVRLYETVGTMSYAAPEVLDGTCGYLGEKADVWSLGVVLYAMVFGQLPYTTREETVKSVLKLILSTKLSFPTRKSTEFTRLVRQMLHVEPSKRITLQQILTHPWVLGNYKERTVSRVSVCNSVSSGATRAEKIITHSAATGDPEGATIRVPQEGANNIPQEGANSNTINCIPLEGANIRVPREGANILRGEGANNIPQEGATIVRGEGANNEKRIGMSIGEEILSMVVDNII
ncbi:Protein kinase domain protein [Theileria parva strain Muguga]|uniref:Serine/threonine protein kinase, putative n=1 Tax=Theileria parva TaxID=5875 RepID=Q4N365_THEPA|nr:Protein kinase domain protein [Theileria parva strain Muguga]EAN31474.1 Protein kinase domain protein [Theileria parva strain Muguga]|eukprot:XP_763757.1 serine/threonine protein kinase [Theileria parva strain Muguga]